ncbi:MAG: zinc-ribbon domain containing protein [Chloroflexi bacterium]|nr:zinc-ribbon domain containing protein [Chloroflexota bacterium]
MPDKTLTCRDCGVSFVFTEGEQAFYASRGFTNEPSRCATCRAARRGERGGSAGGPRTGGGGYERSDRTMYPAVCAECGRETQVPFQPSGDKPVYCSDCFESRRSRSRDSRSTSGGYGRRR